MNIDRQYELDEQEIADRYNNGEIDDKKYRKEIGALRREYRAYAEESAQDAYNREMDRW